MTDAPPPETAPPRIVSLLASATEIVCALGFGGHLVGRSHECDHPPEVRALPVVTEPCLDPTRPSLEIDRQVKERLKRALSLYEVDTAALRALAPDVIVTQTQCEVCAVSLADVERALADWTGAEVRLVSLHPNMLADIWADVRRVAKALGAAAAGETLVAELRARMAAIDTRARALPERPRIACVEWIEPLMAGGNWMPELVEMAGGQDCLGRAGAHSAQIAFQDLAAADPEVILVQPCGFDMPRTRAEMPTLAAQPGWAGLGAVKAGRVYLTDGNQYFNRPGPRIVESLEILAEVLHPEAFDFGHKGHGWARYAD
jgi:iron complex transport system substrate-binding protein